MTITMSKITTPIAEYSKMSSKLRGGELSSPADGLASFAEGFFERSGVSFEVVRGRCGDSGTVVVVCGSRSDICEGFPVTWSTCEGAVEVIGGGREGIVGGGVLSKFDVCSTTGSDTVTAGDWELVVAVGNLVVSSVSPGIDIVVAGRVVEGALEAVVGEGFVGSVVKTSRSTHVDVRDICTLCFSQFVRVLEIAY